jgi:hypothetical protein
MRMQEKILGKIEEIAVSAGHELVINFDYGNTGVAYVHRKDSFDVVVGLNFHFQPQYASIKERVGSIGHTGRDFSMTYDKPSTINAFFVWFRGMVA